MDKPSNIDWRDIKHGDIIPSEKYTDQPYIIKTNDGAWLCTLTTGSGHEGQKGQHVITYRSLDKGKTWVDYNELEPADGPESAYSVLLKTPDGRVFVFYNYNSENIREVPADPGPTFNGVCRRVDCLGDFVFRYSDDNGLSWSDKRYIIDVREMEIDRKNCFGGIIRFFWNVGKPFWHNNCAFVPLIKVGGFGEGCYTSTEGVLLKCSNITSVEPDNLSWETLPDGEFGLKTPPGGGLISEEQSYSVLSDDSFFCVYRSIDGYPVCSYSRDGGHSWSSPEYMRYADGRLIKHPRAANFAWRCANGKFLYWFHNHGGRDFAGRNPAWGCGGIEADSPDGRIIKWSQPEIILYDKDPLIAMSYPDLIEDDELYITETQKKTARVHKINRHFLEKLWSQFEPKRKILDGHLLEITTPETSTVPIYMSELPEFISKHEFDTEDLNTGFTIELVMNTANLPSGVVLLDSRIQNGVGFCVMSDNYHNVKIILNNGITENHWSSDPNTILNGETHYITIVVDGGSETISFIIDGKFNDGGISRQFGWGRFKSPLKPMSSSGKFAINKYVEMLRIYSRILMTSEAIGNYEVTKFQQSGREQQLNCV